MLGYSGYGTTEYGSRRSTGGIAGPAARLAMRVLQSGYGVANALVLRFRRTALTDPSGMNNNPLNL